jgi:hypothetical protein
MSAAWMKANGMRDCSTPSELDKRVEVAPHLGKPTKAEYLRAYANVGRRPFLTWWTRLRIRIFGQRFESSETVLLLSRLPLVELTPNENRYAGRWTPAYVAQLAGAAVKHIKLQSARFTQWMLK